MNQQLEKLAAKARSQITVAKTVRDEDFLEKFSKLLIEECVQVIDDMQFSKEGPSDEARYQRTLCGVTIKEYFGLQSKGPISSKNVL